MRKALTITVLAVAAAGVTAGCSSDRRIVRTETVETVPMAPVVEQTTIRTVPAPAPVYEQRTYESGTVEHRTKTIETYDD